MSHLSIFLMLALAINFLTANLTNLFKGSSASTKALDLPILERTPWKDADEVAAAITLVLYGLCPMMSSLTWSSVEPLSLKVKLVQRKAGVEIFFSLPRSHQVFIP
jgi:hypothetical protein